MQDFQVGVYLGYLQFYIRRVYEFPLPGIKLDCIARRERVTVSPMLCPQRSVLLNDYIAATERQTEAVSALVKSKDNPQTLPKALTATEEAFGGTEQARILLRQHIETHGC
jgi:hypothetical protein